MARALYEQGFTTPVAVAAASRAELLRTLRKTLPHHVPKLHTFGLTPSNNILDLNRTSMKGTSPSEYLTETGKN